MSTSPGASASPTGPGGAGATDPLATVSSSTRDVLRRLELEVTRRLDGMLHGDHRGLVPGHGSELGETRRYAPGDDVRRIDWNVTARLPETHIRETIAERELQTWLVVDRSPRLAFGTAGSEKQELALAAAAAVGFLTNRDGNRIGATFAGPGEPHVVPPRGSRRHFLGILHDIATADTPDGSGITDLGAALGRVATVSKRRGLVVVISDFLVTPDWERPLRILSQRNDVLAMLITDPRDRALPDVGLVSLRDPATGAVREVATNKRKVRERFAQAAAERHEALVREFRAARVDHVELSTDRAWLDDLVRFVSHRAERLARRNAGTP